VSPPKAPSLRHSYSVTIVSPTLVAPSTIHRFAVVDRGVGSVISYTFAAHGVDWLIAAVRTRHPSSVVTRGTVMYEEGRNMKAAGDVGYGRRGAVTVAGGVYSYRAGRWLSGTRLKVASPRLRVRRSPNGIPFEHSQHGKYHCDIYAGAWP
jgi:hypothetical protein